MANAGTDGKTETDEQYLIKRGWTCADPGSKTGHKWRKDGAGPGFYRTWDAVRVQMDIDAGRGRDD